MEKLKSINNESLESMKPSETLEVVAEQFKDLNESVPILENLLVLAKDGLEAVKKVFNQRSLN